MPDEQNYVSHLVEMKDAMERLDGIESMVVSRAYDRWQQTIEFRQQWQQAEEAAQRRQDEANLKKSKKPGMASSG